MQEDLLFVRGVNRRKSTTARKCVSTVIEGYLGNPKKLSAKDAREQNPIMQEDIATRAIM